ncbi:MAG: hypothetical protein ABIN01_12525, partial [Ferruginibacter sp.]
DIATFHLLQYHTINPKSHFVSRSGSRFRQINNAYQRVQCFIVMRNLEFEEDGYILVFHEDFLNGHSLHEDIQGYSFFEYETNKALHLAPKEEKIIWNIFNTIEQEYNNSEDEFSREIILAGIHSLLKYSERFYKRQLINRKQLSGKTVTAFNKSLQKHIWDADIKVTGKRKGFLKAQNVKFRITGMSSGIIQAELGIHKIEVDLSKGLSTGVPGELR